MDRSALRPPSVLRSGFSLMELLVVIAVIAVIASLLLSAFTLVRSAARSAVCMNNLRQLDLGVRAFGEDHDGELMCASGGNVWRWFRDIMPYLTHNAGNWNDNPSILAEVQSVSRCPAFKGVITDPADGNVQWDSRGYAINGHPLTPQTWSHTMMDWWWWGGAGGPARMVHLAEVTHQSERYELADSNWGLIIGDNWFNDWKGMLRSGHLEAPSVWGDYSSGRPYEARHREMRNVIFFDGSCRAVGAADRDWLQAN